MNIDTKKIVSAMDTIARVVAVAGMIISIVVTSTTKKTLPAVFSFTGSVIYMSFTALGTYRKERAF